MAIVILRGPLQKLAGQTAEHSVEGATVTELLEELERTHAGLEGWILDERGVVRRHINVFVNGERAQQEATVVPADRIEILPAISGGSGVGQPRAGRASTAGTPHHRRSSSGAARQL